VLSGKQRWVMKIKALLVVICCLLAMVSCENIYDLFRQPDNMAPDGKGSFSLQIAGQDSRTIMPNIPVFKSFVLEFSGTQEHTEIIPADKLSETVIYLIPGDYTLAVTVCIEENGNKPTAKITSSIR
jgi:hypothetical protein